MLEQCHPKIEAKELHDLYTKHLTLDTLPGDEYRKDVTLKGETGTFLHSYDLHPLIILWINSIEKVRHKVPIKKNRLVTFCWEKKGESQTSGEYVEFLEALRRAEAEAVVSNVEVIAKAAQGGDWRAAAWFLEHKYPNNWARLEKRAVEDFIPDTNKDVVQKRVEEYWAEVERRRMAFPENTNKLITELQGRGYEVYEKKNHSRP